ncbi:MAG: acyltransferase [Patescibacteria group bacterium]
MSKILTEIGFNRLAKYFFFGLWEIIFKLLPYSPLRTWWLKLGGAKIGPNCVFSTAEFINLDRTGLKGLSLGKDCFIGHGVLLDLAGRLTLESQVTVAARSIILSHHSVGFSDHPLVRFYPKKILHTVIRSGSVIGVSSIILPGIVVGKNSLVAAASLVNHNVPNNVMVAGVPAQVKKKLT